jgi:hypothetical protein
MNEKTAPPTYIVVADLFFRSKIKTVAAAAGVSAHFARNFDELQTALTASKVSANIIVDLNDRSLRPLEFLPLLAQAGHRLLGFVAHSDTATIDAARAAGCEVMPRSKFVENLPKILIGQFND